MKRKSVATGDEWDKAVAKFGDALRADYRRLFDRAEHAEAQIKEHGALVAAPNGFPTKNPWLSVAEKARSEMRVIEKMVFGIDALPGKKQVRQKEAEIAASKFAAAVPPRLVAAGGKKV